MMGLSPLLLVSVFAWSALAQMDGSSEIKEKSDAQAKDICTRQEYRQAALKVLANMENGTEPCDDFYQFACGRFIERAQIPVGSQHVDAFTENSDILVQQIAEIITKTRPESDPSYFKLPNQLFNSCINRTLIDSLSDTPVQEISNSLGGWPVVVGDSWDSTNSWSWQQLGKKLRRLGFSTDYLMTFSIEKNKENNTSNIINLYQPTFLFQSEFYSTSASMYYDFMVNTAISFGAKKAAAIRELSKSFRLELDLVDISQTASNINYAGSLLSIKQLQDLYPYVQWLDLINSLLPEGLTIDENEVINLLSPSFFDKLGSLLARNDKRTIANYIMWTFHYFAMNFLSKGFRNRRHQFEALALGSPPEDDVLTECIFIVLQRSLYIHNYFNQSTKITVTEIFENIRSAFSQTLHESQWLDDDTKEEAKRKLHSMKALIGFADEVFDIGIAEDYYRELEIDENKYFQSYLNIKNFDLNKRFHELRLPANGAEWLRNTILSASSPTHDITRNEINVPAAFLQGQLLNTERPNYMNYGSVGSHMAHEIIHGFCGDGCKYCADGEEREWWQPASMLALSEKEKCFIEQYSNYTDKQTGLKINGLQTLEENMADNSGVRLSYLAYKQWQAIHGEELRLPGVKYTAQQLFWISFAQSFCGKFTTGKMARLINTAAHSPHEFRVLGVLRNMKDFSRDFHCPVNSPMNPVQKCEVW